MAITINDQPYEWAVRGQKLYIKAISDQTGNAGFKYSVQVILSGAPYTFYLNPAPDDRLYFDVAPLVEEMRNTESSAYHFQTDALQNDTSFQTVLFELSEWWLVDGILTLNAGSEEAGTEFIVINGYYQAADGFKPVPTTGSDGVKFSLTNNTSNAMTDRKYDTHSWYLAPSWSQGAPTSTTRVWIPSYESDYGILCIPGSITYLSNNDINFMRIAIVDSAGSPTIQTIAITSSTIKALPVYPANLNDWTGLTVKPSLFPDWRYYEVEIRLTNSTRSIKYIFYNAYRYGQSDCHNDKIRLGWVNSRGGWDYFNFTKRSEFTNEIQRKQYRKPLQYDFSTIDRGLVQRRNIMQQVLSVTSDFITEEEFIYLRSLMASNQVTWLTVREGENIALPVTIDDTTYTEKKTRDGKLYNVSFKVRMANEYWT